MYPRSLAVFDFDHTILNDNSDTAIVDLLGKNNIPQEVKDLQHHDGWTAFMQGVFTTAFQLGIAENTIKERILSLPPVQGMPNLISDLKKTEKYDVIIISDSNTLFINLFLEHHGLDKSVFKVFSNPSQFVDGELKIEPYHHQETCKLSTKNMCKGQIMEDFITERKKEEVFYNKVVYVGDGVNDFCPILRLNNNDVACVRHNYKLEDIIKKAQEGKSFDNSGQPHILRADILIWDNGDDILKKIIK